MRHSRRHRTLCALAALSLVFSAAPGPVAAMTAKGDLPACSVADGTAVNETAVPNPPLAGTVIGTELDPGGQPCGPGPCSMPFTTCATAGACLSAAPLPAGDSPSLSPGLVGVDPVGTRGSLPSPASRILTPPPRS